MSTDILQPRAVTHSRLSTETQWEALGDLALLDAERFEPVIISRSMMPAKVAEETRRLVELAHAGVVMVGGFISFGEKQVARKLAQVPNLKLIRILPFTLANYPLTPSVKQRIREGKTLILSGFLSGDTTLTRTNCVKMNRWILQCCQAHAAPLAPQVPPAPAPIAPKAPIAPEDDPAAIFL